MLIIGAMMQEKTLVIVESPTKAKTIKRFLPKHFSVEASIGHVRDLPQSASDIPKSLKKEPWARLGIDVENGFKPLYITPKGKGKVIRELKKKVKEADMVLLATDEDREGESISWHLREVLQPKCKVKRLVFHEITKNAIEYALQHERDINMNLVNAQETRRILDRLYGYTLSPLVWKKIAYGLSAGRVQSPGLRLLVERERERTLFKKSVYWDIKALLSVFGTTNKDGEEKETRNNETRNSEAKNKDSRHKPFEARLESISDVRVAEGKDFDPAHGGLLKNRKVVHLDEEQSRDLAEKLRRASWIVESVTEKRSTTRPAPPFITSTLQQEGNRKLRMSARETMRTAQRLYEQGFITYMRTDSPALSQEGIRGAAECVKKLYGDEYLVDKPRQYASKSRSAQEAHEAIRPAGERFVHPDESGLQGREKALYALIWKRTVATQMAEAKKVTVTAKIRAVEALFTAAGTRIVFPGFIRVYVEGKDDPEAALDDRESYLPPLTEGQELNLENLEPQYHETKPPARYTEASLVSTLEKMGIGRPSTYASIINTLYEREYARKEGTALVPTFTGFAVVQLLENHFHYLIEYNFTSDMEDDLDSIALGEIDRLEYLQRFYLGENGLAKQVEEREKAIKPEESRTIRLPQLSNVEGVKVGKYGPYVVHDEVHTSIPEDIPPADITEQDVLRLVETQKNGPEPIGQDPESGKNIYCLTGRYGPYLQLGEKSDEEPKPKRASLPKGTKPEDIDLEHAVKLLSLPRKLGSHPDTGKEVVANNGRFGPYVMHDGDFRSLKADDDLYTVSLERALELLAEPKKGRGGSKVLKDFGKEAVDGKKAAVYSGRYGPYIKFGTKNIPLPKELRDQKAIDSLTVEEVKKIIKAAPAKKK